ncbi:MAG: hypothetical protein AB1714_08455 [Acidobacteriota bacterium]
MAEHLLIGASANYWIAEWTASGSGSFFPDGGESVRKAAHSLNAVLRGHSSHRIYFTMLNYSGRTRNGILLPHALYGHRTRLAAGIRLPNHRHLFPPCSVFMRTQSLAYSGEGCTYVFT